MRRVRVTVLIVIVLLLAHGGVWYAVAESVRARLTQARNEATARMIDLRVGGVERAGYPLAAGVVWHDVEFGPRGLPFGAKAAIARIALTVVPSLVHAPTYRAELLDPLRITLASGATVVLAAPDARIETAWGNPGTATLTATAVVVGNPIDLARVARLRGDLRADARTLAVEADGIDLLGGT